MALLNRRQSLKLFLDGLLTTAGTVVLASTVLPPSAAQGETSSPGQEATNNLEERANQLADLPGAEGEQFCAFVNGGFRNSGGGGGSFRNGAFTNGGGGGGGSFKNGGFVNGGGGGGGFHNGGWTNGGFPR